MCDKLKNKISKKLSVTMTPVCKRKINHPEHGSVDETALVALNVTSNQIQPINVGQESLKLDNMVENRQIQANNTVFATFHPSSNSLQSDHVVENGYNSIEYVSSPVVSMHRDHQTKFSDELISDAANVNFVEINESAVKTSNTPLELYFDVIPTTSNSNIVTSSPYIPRQEHQAPKAQILVRAYSDFLQSQENQMHSIQVESPHEDDNNSEYTFREMLNSNITQLDEVLPEAFIEYKKPIKMESPKKMPLQFQQSKQNIPGDIENCKTIPSHASEIHSDFNNHDPHIIHGTQQDNRHQHYILQPTQQQQRYQLMPKYSPVHQKSTNDYQINTLGSKILSGNAIIMQNIGNENSQQMSTNQHNGRVAKEQDVHYANDSTALFSRNSHFSNDNGSFFSRSGRLIRRRPEYLEYVNEENINHEIIQESTEPHLPVDMNIHPSMKDKEIIQDSEEHDFIVDSISFDQTNCEPYVDGKKSLPHKKRIQKNYKKSKKCIKPFMCSVCGEQFVDISQFNEHKVIHDETTNKFFICEICNIRCDTQFKFYEHLKTHYVQNEIFKCEICGGEFNSSEHLEQHSTIHSSVQFQCIACQKTFRKQSVLDGHMKLVHFEEYNKDQLFFCSICSKEFNSKISLDSHACLEEQGDGTELNCEDCYKFFKTKAKLIAHRKSEHKEEMNKKKGPKKKGKNAKLPKNGYPCTQCTRTFIHKNSLNYHMRRHTGERPHQCDQCGKAFFAASALKVHKRLHTGEKPFKCEECGKFFRQWGDLKYHASSLHSDKRQFQCEYCGKDFKRKYCLVVHRRIHTGEKKYKCDYCDKLFRASSYLQNHIRVHTGERPYPCPDCGKAFRVRSDMKRHRLTHRRDTYPNKNFYPPAKPQQIEDQMESEQKADSPEVLQRHSPNEVQIIQNAVGEGQLLVAENIQTVLGDQYPIRIMVSGISSHTSQPPPAHRQSQISCVNMNAMAAYAPSSPCTNSNSASSISSEGIIIGDGAQQPVNLNVIPRNLTQASVSGEHAVSIDGDQYEIISTGRGSLRPDDSVCVWTGVL